jgi:hypothetical protein
MAHMLTDKARKSTQINEEIKSQIVQQITLGHDMSNRLIRQMSLDSNVSIQTIKLYWQKMRRTQEKNILAKSDNAILIPTFTTRKITQTSTALKNKRRNAYIECMKYIARKYTSNDTFISLKRNQYLNLSSQANM